MLLLFQQQLLKHYNISSLHKQEMAWQSCRKLSPTHWKIAGVNLFMDFKGPYSQRAAMWWHFSRKGIALPSSVAFSRTSYSLPTEKFLKLIPQVSDKSYLLWNPRFHIRADGRRTTVLSRNRHGPASWPWHLPSCVNFSLSFPI